MLLCCYLGDCSTMQGLVMAPFIDWPEKDWSFVFCNITSHHITSHYIEQNISLVKSWQWETKQCNHQIFNTSHKSQKIYVFVILHIQSRQQSRQMWCTAGAPSAGTNTQRNTLNSAGWSNIAIFAWLVVLDDWLIGMMTKECYRW